MIDGVDDSVFGRLKSFEDEFGDSAGTATQIDDFSMLANFCKIEQAFVNLGVER